ncbi:prolipoprotein diacylglyceryl transferase [Leekyejoonella antrihumi]|uniref:Phosphatidylglycerol--prolipoprotein diacylglyceryl transferase n=1 Tax=Leekyejoonella antrihumi TaxID=1660198 RepID=A0A563DTI2_9MICO|nr:prolipoprotein diacylglyceryl transferase [Leekyejoonella antrihumi]TWP33568.1 prolipoprotein diacylglyceryl transferase [Leekyejoonella antrihumi]
MTAALAGYIPSPTAGVLWLGPIPIRGYALCILAGICVAIWVCGRRLADRGARTEDALTVAWWAVPFGIVGGRIYNVITTPQPYFGKGGDPWDAFAIWHGGLGIWGAVALGALGAWIGCRRNNIAFLDFADAAAPGVVLAQAMGRWGNYFNNELYGRPTNVPWALKIYQWDEPAGHAVHNAAGQPVVQGLFQPTFLYASLWCLIVAIIVLAVDRHRMLGRGRSFALYVILYPVGRIVVELMRSDFANHILGLRVNVWVCMIVFLFGVTIFVLTGRRHPDGIREGLPQRETATVDATT